MTVSTLPQGDPALLQHPTAQRLLASTELARLGYVAHDGTPRVFPMLFHWTGEELVVATFAGARKIAALRARPEVAVTIDTTAMPPEVLLLRGPVEVTEVDGIVPEYRLAYHRYAGPEQGERSVAEIDRPGVRMVRIARRPAGSASWTSPRASPAGRPPTSSSSAARRRTHGSANSRGRPEEARTARR